MADPTLSRYDLTGLRESERVAVYLMYGTADIGTAEEYAKVFDVLLDAAAQHFKNLVGIGHARVTRTGAGRLGYSLTIAGLRGYPGLWHQVRGL